MGKSRPYVLHTMRLFRLNSKVRAAVRHRTPGRDQGLTLLKLEPEQQLILAEEIQKRGLMVKETRERVREMLGKSLKWRLVPMRIEPSAYDRLVQIAPEGDVTKLLKQAVERLLIDV